MNSNDPSTRTRVRLCGLHKISPESLGKALDETATAMAHGSFAFYGASVFCILTLLAPDSILLTNSEQITIPFVTGAVSYVAFLFLGPSIVLAIGIYLQFYYEHLLRLEGLGRRIGVSRAPTLLMIRSPLIGLRGAIGLGRAAVFPLLAFFAYWKANPLLLAGGALGTLGILGIVLHFGILRRTGTGKTRDRRWVGRLMIAAVIVSPCPLILTVFIPHRALDLSSAVLADRNLSHEDNLLRGANFDQATIKQMQLFGSDLSFSKVFRATITASFLDDADFDDARFKRASSDKTSFAGAHFHHAKIIETHFEDSDFSDAEFDDATLDGVSFRHCKISPAQLDKALLDDVCIDGVPVSPSKKCEDPALERLR